jgi:hypothetical protein
VDDVRGIPADSSLGDPGGGSDQTGTVFDPVRVPGEVKMMPHKHPANRVYTVMSGMFCVGLGEQCDENKLSACAPGSIVVLPGNQPHFYWAKRRANK